MKVGVVDITSKNNVSIPRSQTEDMRNKEFKIVEPNSPTVLDGEKTDGGEVSTIEGSIKGFDGTHISTKRSLTRQIRKSQSPMKPNQRSDFERRKIFSKMKVTVQKGVNRVVIDASKNARSNENQQSITRLLANSANPRT